MGAGQDRRLNHLFFGCIGIGVGYVAVNAAHKYVGFLRYLRHVAPQIVKSDVLYRYPIDEDLPLVRIIEPRNHIDQRRLARAGTPYNAQHPAAFHLQADIF